MAVGEGVDVKRNPTVALLVDRFMRRVEEVADDGDWAESDGWVGRMVLRDKDGDQVYVYAVKDGEMRKTTSSSGPFVATTTMSVKTFLDLMQAAVGKGSVEAVFQVAYGAGRIEYEGKRWIVDSERFRKVFRRLGAGR